MTQLRWTGDVSEAAEVQPYSGWWQSFSPSFTTHCLGFTLPLVFSSLSSLHFSLFIFLPPLFSLALLTTAHPSLITSKQQSSFLPSFLCWLVLSFSLFCFFFFLFFYSFSRGIPLPWLTVTDPDAPSLQPTLHSSPLHLVLSVLPHCSPTPPLSVSPPAAERKTERQREKENSRRELLA